MKKKLLSAVIILLIGTLPSFAQIVHKHKHKHDHSDPEHLIRCSTVERERARSTDYDQGITFFENWISEKTKKRKVSNQRTTETYAIPYIVHIIHTGDAIGAGNNIPYEQVESQMLVLNQDFRRENPDSVNTPGVFKEVATGFDIQFVPASIDEDGNPLAELGVERVEVAAVGDPDALKAATSWDARRYLNIWVMPLGGNLLGYATFPGGSNLPGMPGAEDLALSGVVMTTQAFGSNYTAFGSDFNLFSAFDGGRTTTHEIGHWLGLRHIWGDGGCGVDDFCADTPTAGDSYQGSSCAPNINSCDDGEGDLRDMIENFMDYSNDRCMNLFTADQVDRMVTVIENSPGRVELLTSNVALGETDIIAGFTGELVDVCDKSTLTFNNASSAGSGTTILTWEWNFDVNETGNASLTTAEGEGPHTIVYSTPGEYLVSLTVTSDLDSVSTSTRTILVEESPADADALALPFTDDFEDAENGSEWVLLSDNAVNWEYVNVGSNSSTSVAINNFDTDETGTSDLVFASPFLEVADADSLFFSFDWAYSPWNTTEFFDGLSLIVATGCHENYQVIQTFSLNELTTSAASGAEFIPQGPEDWGQYAINVAEFMDLTEVETLSVGFQSIPGFGNWLYIDNVAVTEEGPEIPNAPSELTVSVVSETEASLSWVDNADNEEGFVIQRSIEGSDFETIIVLGANSTSFDDVTVATNGFNTQLVYQVYSFTGSFGSESTEGSATIRTNTNTEPGSLTVTMDATDAQLTWDDNTDDEEGFFIEISFDNETFIELATVDADVNTFIDTSLPATAFCETFAYRVSAFAGELTSVPSNTAETEVLTFADNVAPTEFTVELVENNAELNWTNNTDEEENILIERSVASGAFTLLETFGPGITSFTEDVVAFAGESVAYRLSITKDECIVVSNVVALEVPIVLSLPASVKNQIQLYPNPTQSGDFTLQLPSEIRKGVSIELLSISGKRIFVETLEAANDGTYAGKLPQESGMYIVRLVTPLGNTFFKLVKE